MCVLVLVAVICDARFVACEASFIRWCTRPTIYVRLLLASGWTIPRKTGSNLRAIACRYLLNSAYTASAAGKGSSARWKMPSE